MEKNIISVPDLFSYAQYGFEHCVTFQRLIFITGQAGINKNGEVISELIEKQAEATFENIQYALKAAGSNLHKLLSMTCYIVDIQKNGPAFWTVRKKMMPSTGYTSATIGVSALADPKLLLEIQCIGYR
jgi:enamine deaminase RidA (YjgF/YER057c/UK114 family)